jgi:tRNA threonylcarbamoyladenosine biosynthesis protein TsaB
MASTILNIESSTTMCSVSIAIDGASQVFRSINEGYSHAEKLAVFVDEAIKESGIQLNQLDAIAISKGPGSYTGLRIGVSSAKGLAYSLGKPLIAVQTLQIMCLHPEVKRQINLYKDLVLCPMLDARRMEVYTAVYDIGLKEMIEVQPMILDELSFHDLLSQEGVLFFGSGSSKFKDILKNDSAYFVEGVWPQASEMAMLSQMKYDQNEFEDLAYFEPFYLKEFQGTTPKKLL